MDGEFTVMARRSRDLMHATMAKTVKISWAMPLALLLVRVTETPGWLVAGGGGVVSILAIGVVPAYTRYRDLRRPNHGYNRRPTPKYGERSSLIAPGPPYIGHASIIPQLARLGACAPAV